MPSWASSEHRSGGSRYNPPEMALCWACTGLFRHALRRILRPPCRLARQSAAELGIFKRIFLPLKAPPGPHEYYHVTYPARSDIPLSIHTLDALPRVQHVRCVKQDRGVMYG